jgi:hypothetical protein
LQSQAFNNIQRSIEKSVTRIFRFWGIKLCYQ